MSELKLISPLLDNYDVGSSISNHNGVQCYPAMMKDTNDRYIIKNISIPASQTQLEALLLTGAYPDADSALSYFHAVADGVVEELETLKKLSMGEGFAAYDDWQLALKEDAFGYDVCMVGAYKYTLRKYLQHNPITHLTAVTLGLDICQALSTARKAGFLYVDLKPNNIYVDGRNFQIGDLGFLRLDSLQYASIPDKYCSAYTAPEALDAFVTLTPTIDIYALGLILYQAYNGGELPFTGAHANAEAFAAPIFADYEMSEIILKACNPNPDERWQNPEELSQALVSYMQRNGANDTPIVPATIELPDEELEEILEASENTSEAVSSEGAAANNDIIDEIVNHVMDLTEIAVSAQVESPAAESTDNSLDELAFLNDLPTDETSPENNVGDVAYSEVSDELSEILAQADELVAEPIPEPPVAPEGKSIEEIVSEEDSSEECTKEHHEDTSETNEEATCDECEEDSPDEDASKGNTLEESPEG